MTISEEIRTLLHSKGADLVGFADLQQISSDVRENFPFGISIAVALDSRAISHIKEGPTKQYFEEYERANHLLDELGHHAVVFIKERGYQATCLAVTSIGIDPVTLSTQLPHKTTATRAGLGWIGKCALLITKEFGSAVRLTTVLTDARLPIDNSMDTNLCGKCTSCVDICPGHAPLGKNWQLGLHRDAFFNAFACGKTAWELAIKKTGIRETLCGMCIAACPWTQKYVKRTT